MPLEAEDALPRRRKPYSKVACMRCRRLRKKCMGGFPCSRCMGAGHACQVLNPADGTVHTHAVAVDEPLPPVAAPSTEALESRVAALEGALAPVRSIEETMLTLQSAVRDLAPPRPRGDASQLVARFGGTLGYVKGTLVMGNSMHCEHVDWHVSRELFGVSPREMQGQALLPLMTTQRAHIHEMFEDLTLVLGPSGCRGVFAARERLFVRRDGGMARTIAAAEGDWMRDGSMRFVVALDAPVEHIPASTARALKLFHTSLGAFVLMDRIIHRLRREVPDTAERDVTIRPARVLAAALALAAPGVEYFAAYDPALPWGRCAGPELPTEPRQLTHAIAAHTRQHERLCASADEAAGGTLPVVTHGHARASPGDAEPALPTVRSGDAEPEPAPALSVVVRSGDAEPAEERVSRTPTSAEDALALFSPLDTLAMGASDDVLQWPF